MTILVIQDLLAEVFSGYYLKNINFGLILQMNTFEMLSQSEYKAIGIISRPYGNDGAMRIRLDSDYNEWYKKLREVFLKIKNKAVPFRILDKDLISSDTLVLKLKGIDSPDMVKKLTGTEVCLPENVYQSISQSGFHYTRLTGYTCCDENGHKTGIIVHISDYSGNLVMEIKDERDMEFMVPLHRELIVKTDDVKKEIWLKIPDGITEI